jgi:hypothetical protein
MTEETIVIVIVAVVVIFLLCFGIYFFVKMIICPHMKKNNPDFTTLCGEPDEFDGSPTGTANEY